MNKRQRVAYWLLVPVGMLLTTAFGLWWFDPEHVPLNFTGFGHVFDWLLFGVLSYVIWHQIISEVLLWWIVRGIKKPKTLPVDPSLHVAFITTFVPGSESIDLLKKTLPAMVQADFPHDTWLLDEGNDPQTKALCEFYGVHHFSRKDISRYNLPSGPFATKTKGGNHNAWYDQHGRQYHVVAQIDTDFIPRKDFLTKTLGYFSDPKVAFVGTPQIYGNTQTSFVAKGAAQQTYGFYGPILRGLFGKNMTLLIGANHVIRVEALEDIGFYSSHITEDLLTGMKFHSRKWRSVYVPEALAVGEGPNTWTAYFSQQMRWAYGCIHILFNHTSKLIDTMYRRQALRYLLLQQHYFTGLAQVLGITLLSMYFLFNINAASMALIPLLAWYLPLLAWQTVIVFWTQRFHISPLNESGALWSGKLVSIAAWPIYFMALIGVLRGKRLSYKVTPKGKQPPRPYDSITIFLPHIVLGTITAVDLLIGLSTGRTSFIMMFWAGLNTAFMYGIALSPIWMRLFDWAKKVTRLLARKEHRFSSYRPQNLQ